MLPTVNTPESLNKRLFPVTNTFDSFIIIKYIRNYFEV